MHKDPSETPVWGIAVGVMIFVCIALFLAGCAFDKFRNELSIERGSLNPSGATIPAKLPAP